MYLVLAHTATIVVELEGRLHIVLQGQHLLITEEILKERKDALTRGRIWRDGELNAPSQVPCWEGGLMGAPPAVKVGEVKEAGRR